MNRWSLNFLLSFFICFTCYCESAAELFLMHQRNPRNTKVLYYLANSYLQDYEFNKAYQYFIKLRALDANFQNLNAGIAHSLYGQGKIYDSYQICRANENQLACEKFLGFFAQKHAKRLRLYEFLYNLRVENNFELKEAEALLRMMPDDRELIEALGNYFFDQNLNEIAFDFLRLVPDAYAKKAIYFRKMLRDLRRQFREIKFEGGKSEKLYFLAYYIWKFAPEFGEDIKAPTVIELMNFFRSKLSQRTQAPFENYYRLAYLQALEGFNKEAESTVGLALNVSPNAVFSFILKRSVEKQLKVKKAVQIISTE